jgi:hypothetical protein
MVAGDALDVLKRIMAGVPFSAIKRQEGKFLSAGMMT